MATRNDNRYSILRRLYIAFIKIQFDNPPKTVSEDDDAEEHIDPKVKGVTLITNLPELAHISEKRSMGVNLSGLVVSKDPGDQVWLHDWVVASVRK